MYRMGMFFKNSVAKGEKSAHYDQEGLKEEKEKSNLIILASNDESELSKLKRQALNANDIESNPGPTSAIFQWMQNFNKWNKLDQQREIIQITVTNHVKDLHEDVLEQRIPEDLYSQQNLLVLQKFQDFYLTNPEALNNSEIVIKLSYLYNAWYKKIREKEKRIINAKEQSIDVDLEHLEQSLKAEEDLGKQFIFLPVTVVESPSFKSATEVPVPGNSEGIK